MKVLVTGANGFLGRHVVAALLARGHRVVAMVRPAAIVEHLRWPAAVSVIRADLRASRSLEDAFEGASRELGEGATVVTVLPDTGERYLSIEF